MSEMPTNNPQIAYSDEINSSTAQLEFVKQSETGPGNEDGQYIYTMPRGFRFGSKTNSGSKVGLLVMLFGLLLFIALVYVGFLVLSKKPIFNFNPDNTTELATPVNKIQPTTTNPINQTEEVVIDLSDPEQAYLQLRLKLDQALTLEDYLNIFIAGASQDKAHQLYEQTIGLEALSESQKSSTLSISKTMLIPISSADQIAKEISGNQATLTITKADTNRSAIVKMLLEGGQWRFDNEGWQDNFIEPATSSPAIIDEPILNDDYNDFIAKEFSLDVDTDQDGLSDKEENILGTNPNSIDSDGDGYDDLSELRAGYNPAGNNKLNGNKGLRLIQHGDWSILMPTLWNSQLGRDNSAIFRADDGQFIQLNIANKLAGQSLSDWYQEIFKVFTEQVPDIVVTNQHQTVVSPDGLTYYITKPELNYLISLTYNPESNGLLSYNNIFRLMSDSLVIDN